MDVTREVLTHTKVGSNLAYIIAYNNPLVNVVNYLKPVSYGVTGLSFGADIYLSANIDPSTGKQYQSWGETGMNTSVTIGSLIVGGWLGIAIQLDYQASKAYMNTIITNPEWGPYPYKGFNH